MLTNLASIADKRESERGKSIRILRTVETLMNTVLTIMLYLHISEGWMIAVAIVGLIGVIWICSVLFGLARELENKMQMESGKVLDKFRFENIAKGYMAAIEECVKE